MKRPATRRSFLVLLAGSGVDQIGSQVALIATVFWLRQRSDAAALLGLSATFWALPTLLLGPLGGVCADRWSRRKILLGSYFLSCLTCLGLIGLSSSVGLSNSLVFAGLFTANVLLASSTAFAQPAMNAFLADIVAPEQLNQAMSLMQALSLPAIIGGQALGALLLQRVPLPVLFGFDAVTYIICGASLIWVVPFAATAFTAATQPVDVAPRRPLQQRIYADLRGAADYIWHRPGMRFVLLATIPVSVFTETILVFLPIYTTNALHMALIRYPYLTASYSAGLFLGYLAVAREVLPNIERSAVVPVCILAGAMCCGGLALNHSYYGALGLLCSFGFFTGAFSLLCLNELLAQTDSDKRGRISAVVLMITQGLTPLTMGLLGVAVDQLAGNVRPIYGACGVAFVLLAVLSFSSRALRYFFAQPSSSASAH